MSLKFRDEAERQELVRRHAEMIGRTLAGEITVDEASRLSRAMVAPFRKKQPQRGMTAR